MMLPLALPFVKKTSSPTEESHRDSSDRTTAKVQRTAEEQLALAIRELRQSLSLTQVHLAAALEITPTSVYRYEAGTSFPGVNTLATFWQFAIEKRSPAAIAFTAILGRAIPALRPVLETPFQLDPAKLSASSEAKLSPEEGLLVMAFMKLLEASSMDPVAAMARRVSETLLDPWHEQSKKELSDQIHGQFRQTPKQAREAGSKTARKKQK